MIQFVYIHGFNSGPTSRSGKELSHLLGRHVFCPFMDYSLPFGSCFKQLSKQITAAIPDGQRICVMGSSLGGFFALQLRDMAIAQVIAWNPVIYPALQLAQFVGLNRRFTDGKEWNFSAATLLSYAQAPDPRQWQNFLNHNSHYNADKTAPPERIVILGLQDELLDSTLAHEFWNGFARLIPMDSGHSIQDYNHVLYYLNTGSQCSTME